MRSLVLVIALLGCTKHYSCEACAEGVCEKGSPQYRQSEAVARCAAAESLCGTFLVDGKKKAHERVCGGHKIDVQTGCDEGAFVDMKITCRASSSIPLPLDL